VRNRTRRTAWTALPLLTVVIGSATLVPFSTRGIEQVEPGVRETANLQRAVMRTVQLAEDGVTVTGTLVSADTGDPIGGGRVIILNPGISPTGYADDPSNPDAVFADAQSDLNGRFQAAPPVRREQTYGVIVVARGFLGKVAENKQFAGPDDPPVVDLGEIRMQSAA
jgi:hypothetical protein